MRAVHSSSVQCVFLFLSFGQSKSNDCIKRQGKDSLPKVNRLWQKLACAGKELKEMSPGE